MKDLVILPTSVLQPWSCAVTKFQNWVENFGTYKEWWKQKKKTKPFMANFLKNRDNQKICQSHIKIHYIKKVIFMYFFGFVSCIMIKIIIVLQAPATLLTFRWSKLHSCVGNKLICLKSIGAVGGKKSVHSKYLSSYPSKLTLTTSLH